MDKKSIGKYPFFILEIQYYLWYQKIRIRKLSIYAHGTNKNHIELIKQSSNAALNIFSNARNSKFINI